jgi:hypothetical protein
MRFPSEGSGFRRCVGPGKGEWEEVSVRICDMENVLRIPVRISSGCVSQFSENTGGRRAQTSRHLILEDAFETWNLQTARAKKGAQI